MRRRLIGLAALIALAVAPMTAVAQQKTAKQCNDEWTANKAAIQAAGKKKKDFIAECRGTEPAATAAPAAATPAAATPAAAGAPAAPQRTATECENEWKANKAAIQASGKKKKDFIAECRGTESTAAAPPSPPPAVAKPVAAPPPTPAAAPAARVTPTTGVPATARSAVGQFETEVAAKAHCPGDTVVWANLDSKIYHFSGSRDYGHTKSGAYMCEQDTAAAGIRAAKNEKHP